MLLRGDHALTGAGRRNGVPRTAEKASAYELAVAASESCGTLAASFFAEDGLVWVPPTTPGHVRGTGLIAPTLGRLWGFAMRGDLHGASSAIRALIGPLRATIGAVIGMPPIVPCASSAFAVFRRRSLPSFG
jgi:hypothetical protein